MQKNMLFLLAALCLMKFALCQEKLEGIYDTFPKALVHFVPYKNNPVFSGTGAKTWDNQIRERGYILKEGNAWHLWYTGYPDINDVKHFGSHQCINIFLALSL